MEKASRGKRASENQKEFLISYLEENIDIANDKFVTANDAKFRDQKWKELAVSLNALGGTQKDGQKWKKYWSDFKLHTRAKYSEIKQAEQRSSINGLNRPKSLSALEECAIKITTSEAVDGDGTTEVGFGNDSVFDVIICDGVEQEAKYIAAEECITTDAATTSSATNISQPASAQGVSASRPRARKRRSQYDTQQFEKFFKVDGKKLEEMVTANNLQREHIAVLKGQAESSRSDMESFKEILRSQSETLKTQTEILINQSETLKTQTEAIKAIAQANNNLVGKLQQLIDVFIKMNQANESTNSKL